MSRSMRAGSTTNRKSRVGNAPTVFAGVPRSKTTFARLHGPGHVGKERSLGHRLFANRLVRLLLPALYGSRAELEVSGSSKQSCLVVKLPMPRDAAADETRRATAEAVSGGPGEEHEIAIGSGGQQACLTL